MKPRNRKRIEMHKKFIKDAPDYVFCGDDFTGASDTLATLSRAGLRSRLFLSAAAVENCQDLSELDAIGIATATRSMQPKAIKAELRQCGKPLAALAPKVFHYKVCSTFDSSPEAGSIGAAIDALKQALPKSGIMIIGGQPSLRRYCAFSNLFAAAVDDKIYRIDSHPTMANHPVTPMSDADLRDLLGAQGLSSIHGIHHPMYSGDPDMLRLTVHRHISTNAMVLFDAIQQSDLTHIGKLIHEQPSPMLIVGASSVAESYISGLTPRSSDLPVHKPSKPEKPVFILAGSRSQATAAQVEEAQNFTQVFIHPEEIEQGRSTLLEELTATSIKLLERGSNVLAVVTNYMHHSLSRVELAQFTADLTARVTISGHLGRLGVAGGDTSSFVLKALGVESLAYVADIEPGVCLCRLHALNYPMIHGLEVALKGGQMGSPSFFTKLLGSI